jgi:hypothetical protein
MPLVLTESSTLDCAHAGKAKLTATQHKLKVSGAYVLVSGDLSGAPISGCGTPVVASPPAAAPSTPCLTIASAVGGVATKLKVSGKGVLLPTVNGQTSGVVSGTPGTWSVITAGQTKLKAS